MNDAIYPCKGEGCGAENTVCALYLILKTTRGTDLPLNFKKEAIFPVTRCYLN